MKPCRLDGIEKEAYPVSISVKSENALTHSYPLSPWQWRRQWRQRLSCHLIAPLPHSRYVKSIKTLLSWYKKHPIILKLFLMTGKLDETEAKDMQLHLSHTPF